MRLTSRSVVVIVLQALLGIFIIVEAITLIIAAASYDFWLPDMIRFIISKII